MKFLIFVMIVAAGAGIWFHTHREKPAPPPPPLETPKPPEEFAGKAEENILTAVLPAKIPHGSPIGISAETTRSLYDLTGDPNENTRWTAMELLYRIDDPNIYRILSNAISKDPEVKVKMNILGMVSQTKDKQSLHLLASGMKDPDKDVRLTALRALRGFQCAEAIPLISRAIQDSDNEVKLLAINTLASINHDLQQRKQDEQQRLSKQDADRIKAEAEARNKAQGKKTGKEEKDINKLTEGL